jgi:hypothetical protein
MGPDTVLGEYQSPAEIASTSQDGSGNIALNNCACHSHKQKPGVTTRLSSTLDLDLKIKSLEASYYHPGSRTTVL